MRLQTQGLKYICARACAHAMPNVTGTWGTSETEWVQTVALLAGGCWPLGAGCWLLAVGHWPLAVGWCLLVVGRLPLAAAPAPALSFPMFTPAERRPQALNPNPTLTPLCLAEPAYLPTLPYVRAYLDAYPTQHPNP